MSDPVSRLNAALDGRYAAVKVGSGGALVMRLELVVNWFEELRQRTGN